MESTLALLALFIVAGSAWRGGRAAGLVVASALVATAAMAFGQIEGTPSPLVLAPGLALAAWAVDRARARQSLLERSASLDPLTGVLNRQAFSDRARAELRRAERHGQPLTLAFFDVDDFKNINDAHGHAAGDRVLVAIGAALGAHRASDIAARLGGDEFVLLMPDTDAEGAELALDRLRAHLASDLARLGLDASLSIGVSVIAPGETLEVAMERADREMYARKGALEEPTSPRARASARVPRAVSGAA